MTEASHSRLSASLNELFRGYAGPPVAIRTWDGWRWHSAPGLDPACTMVLATPRALRSLLLEGSQVALAEAFIQKEIEIEGDIFSVFDVVEHVLQRPASFRQRILGRLARSAFALSRTFRHGRIHSPARDRAAIAHHYDQPFDFFRPWLGPTVAYSCAYFHSTADSLDQAQTQKLDLICRKLRLQPDENFLDIGCGWGSLILHAAARYRVLATGITLSREQAKVAEQRIARSGLGDCCKVRFQDYRQLDKAPELFDKIASVGMFEHVGFRNRALYFGIAHRILRPGGVFLNHAIARSASSLPRGNDSFINRYVFPDGHLVTLNQTIQAAEEAGFEVRDVENLREHYEITLRRWVEGLRSHSADLLEHVPETAYRIWLLYMAGCAAAFRRADIGVYQVLLSRPERGKSYLPLTRADWYPDDSAARRRQMQDSMTDVLN